MLSEEKGLNDNEGLQLAGNWTLHDATLTAVGHKGAVYNERGLNLRMLEGRNEQLHPMGDGDEPMREVWDYQFNFCLADGKEPDGAMQHECTVAIIGALVDGRQCKVHGTGYVGRDNLGQIEGTFFSPPRVEIAGPDDELTEWDRPE